MLEAPALGDEVPHAFARIQQVSTTPAGCPKTELMHAPIVQGDMPLQNTGRLEGFSSLGPVPNFVRAGSIYMGRGNGNEKSRDGPEPVDPFVS
jgi:hypothetical protein